MKNLNHLKKIKTLVQFSDGSASYIYSYINKNEFVLDLDIKSNSLWKNVVSDTSKTVEERSMHFKKKFFSKTKKF